MYKKCPKCQKYRKESEFTSSANVCRECVAKYNKDYSKRRKEEVGKNIYQKQRWERRVRREAIKKNIPSTGINLHKIKSLRFRMIDFPDAALAFSLSHYAFMKKYSLSVDEYFFVRRQVNSGDFEVF